MEASSGLSNQFNLEQIQILKLIATGTPLNVVLEKIVELIETNSRGICSLILVSPATQTIRHAAAPHLPSAFVNAIENSKIGPYEGSCGAAAYWGKRVFVPDIATHPNWAKYRDFALPFGLRSCWSSPIFSPNQQILGTFAVYYKEPRNPESYELSQVDSATNLASIALMKEQNEQTLRKAEHFKSLIFNGVHDILFYVAVEPQSQFRFITVNDSFYKATGLNKDQVLNKLVNEVIPEPSLSHILKNYHRAIHERRTCKWEETSEYPTGTKYGEITVTPIFDSSKRCTGLIGVIHDLTERKQMEERISASHRIESLGTLAGGIAHDFNNLLTTIIGNLNLAEKYIPADNKAQKNLSNARLACTRAADLTSRILTFGKSVEKTKKEMDLQMIAEETLQFLRPSLPSEIELEVSYEPHLPLIFADPSQIHQVIMNLCTNAIRAMGSRGQLKVDISRVILQEPLVTETIELKPGSYIRLTVADTGHGMKPATIKRIFEPFFTTSAPGKGSGLGLFVVHKVVKEHQGGIHITSKIGEGTKFEIYFPEISEEQPIQRSVELLR